MSKIEWDDSLSIGNDQIDDQHKELIQKLKDLSEAYSHGHEHSKILKTLDFMIDYTDFHFTDEEKLMALHDYPGLEEQKEQHEQFKTTLNNILEDYQDEGPTQSLATSINVFLLNWLVGHIKGVDLKLGQFLSARNISE